MTALPRASQARMARLGGMLAHVLGQKADGSWLMRVAQLGWLATGEFHYPDAGVVADPGGPTRARQPPSAMCTPTVCTLVRQRLTADRLIPVRFDRALSGSPSVRRHPHSAPGTEIAAQSGVIGCGPAATRAGSRTVQCEEHMHGIMHRAEEVEASDGGRLRCPVGDSGK